MKENIDNAQIYGIYVILYVNDLACNSIKRIKYLIPNEDKEAKKIFGALEKRCNRYLRAVNKICGDSNIFYADYSSEVDSIIEEVNKKYEACVQNKYKGCDNFEYLSSVEIAIRFVDLAISTVDNILSNFKAKNIPSGNISSYRLTNLKIIIKDFAKWVFRKNLNKYSTLSEKIVITYEELTKKLFDYMTFETAYEYAIKMEKKDEEARQN